MLRFPFAVLYADTSDCSLSSIPHPFNGLLYFYDLILPLRSHLTASCPVRYASGIAIRSLMYDTHLRATHTTTSSIGGVQIPICLVSNTTDSLQRSVAVLKVVPLADLDLRSEFSYQSSLEVRNIQIPPEHLVRLGYLPCPRSPVPSIRQRSIYSH